MIDAERDFNYIGYFFKGEVVKGSLGIYFKDGKVYQSGLFEQSYEVNDDGIVDEPFKLLEAREVKDFGTTPEAIPRQLRAENAAARSSAEAEAEIAVIQALMGGLMPTE